MDRLYQLRGKDFFNCSSESEHGYETAAEDSNLSLYYSFTDNDSDEHFKQTNEVNSTNVSFDENVLLRNQNYIENDLSPVNVNRQIEQPNNLENNSVASPIDVFIENQQQTTPERIDFHSNSKTVNENSSSLNIAVDIIPEVRPTVGDEVVSSTSNNDNTSRTETVTTGHVASSHKRQSLKKIVSRQSSLPLLKRSLRSQQNVHVRSQSASEIGSHSSVNNRILEESSQTNVRATMLRKPISYASKKTVAKVNKEICNVCRKSIVLTSNLKAHQQRHSACALDKCKYCDRSFKKNVALQKHLKENCEKIPAKIRQKLLMEEFSKKKAQK